MTKKRHINLLRVGRKMLTTHKGQLRVLQQHGDEHRYLVSKHSITAEAEESLKNSWSPHEAYQVNQEPYHPVGFLPLSQTLHFK